VTKIKHSWFVDFAELMFSQDISGEKEVGCRGLVCPKRSLTLDGNPDTRVGSMCHSTLNVLYRNSHIHWVARVNIQ
jgi:hypothetical protein